MKQRDDHGPAFDELDETLRHERGDSGEAAEVARELFAHALLHQRAERLAAGHEMRREARVRAVLERMHGDGTTGKADGNAQDAPAIAATEATSRSWSLKLVASLAAAALVVVAVLFWPRRDWTPMFADQLIERAALTTQSGVHVYEVRLVHRTVRRRQRSTVFHVALAPDRRFHAKLIEGERPLLSIGSEIGSDGKSIWARARTGQTFDLPFDTSNIVQRLTLEPELSYYQLRPLLESVFQGLKFEVESLRVKRSGGREVTLRGKYAGEAGKREETPRTARGASTSDKPTWRERRRRYRRKRYGQRGRRSLRRTPAALLGTHGEIRVVIDEDSGMLLSLNAVETAPAARRLELRRLDVGTRDFNFDPPRIRSAARVSSKAWARLAARGAWQIWRRLWARKPKQDANSKGR